MLKKIINHFMLPFLIFSISWATYAEKYTLVVEATYSPERGKEVYESLRKWLSEKIGHELELIIDKNYYSYWRRANGDRQPDFTFDTPHIAAFRATEKNYKAVAATKEDMVFHLISLDEVPEDSDIQKFLTNKQISMLPNPSLSSIYYNQWFTDLFASPQKNVAALDWQEVVDIAGEGVSDAAIVPHWMFELYPNFLSLKQSTPTPGRTFMASPNVPRKVFEDLQNALLSIDEDYDVGYELLYELNTEGFKKTNIEEYNQLIKLLPNRY